MDKTKKQIGIVDDHEFFRGGLRMALKNMDHVELAFEAENGQELLEKIARVPVDLILLDIKMPIMDGHEVTQKAKTIHPELKILILSMFDNDEYVQKLLEAGVDGFILKNIGKQELETALNHVLNGQQYFSVELMPFFTKQIRQKQDKNDQPEELTKREQEILQLIFEGYSNKEIAERLYISIRTVTNHRANINAKTGANNTAKLLSYAIKNNLVN